MELSGRVNIEAPREAVWDFLIDAESVSECVPGLESLEVIVPDEKFRASAQVGLGTVKVKFSAEVEWFDLDPPGRAKMRGRGTAPGSAGDAIAEMILEEGPDNSTDLIWTADVNVAGTIASLASRMMKSVAKKLSKNFFECVKKKVEG
ncbi:MAG: carbon monoxide dehydrogenase subunit G [Anaerolineales bacterium]|jgi:carbon monoxide dehydrogenase subunit G